MPSIDDLLALWAKDKAALKGAEGQLKAANLRLRELEQQLRDLQLTAESAYEDGWRRGMEDARSSVVRYLKSQGYQAEAIEAFLVNATL